MTVTELYLLLERVMNDDDGDLSVNVDVPGGGILTVTALEYREARSPNPHVATAWHYVLLVTKQ